MTWSPLKVVEYQKMLEEYYENVKIKTDRVSKIIGKHNITDIVYVLTKNDVSKETRLRKDISNNKTGISLYSYYTNKTIKYGSDEYKLLKNDIEDIDGEVMLVASRQELIFINRLLWECDNVKAVYYTDMENPYEAEEAVTKKDRLLWDVQANRSEDNDKGGMSGWNNSYNNKPFTEAELAEYVNNSKEKLEKYSGKTKTALEIGVGSGMIAEKLAHLFETYDGCNISSIVLSRLEKLNEKTNIRNMNLYNYSADEVEKIGKSYDVILMSSVTEYFSGYNYMRDVLNKCINSVKDNGVIFVGDVFDLETKDDYENSVKEYSIKNPAARAKKDFHHELFFPKKFWLDMEKTFKEISHVEITKKLGKLENEINKFRYDVLIHIDKKAAREREAESGAKLYKYQYTYNAC